VRADHDNSVKIGQISPADEPALPDGSDGANRSLIVFYLFLLSSGVAEPVASLIEV
jgi:hypothetical protein